jgi:peptidyl-prolyl cis-trans isomerase SurA
MRKFFITALMALAFLGAKAQNSAPIFMKIGDNVVTKSEFEYIYFKNNSANTLDRKNLDEYVELFKKFKLKVVEAQALGLDTLPAFKKEFNGYRSQLVEPYLIDKDLEEKLCREQYQRLTEDVELSVISARLPRNASAADTLAVYNRMLEIAKRLKKEDFAKVASETSEDNAAKETGGYVGWLTGQMAVYELEKIMYELPVGKISEPVRTSYGYHIIKVLGRRPAAGKVQVAHILKKFADNIAVEEQENVHKQILEIYDSIKAGKDFAQLAQKFSDDKQSARNGGVLQPFGVNRMVSEFEKAAFGLKNAGDISEPIKTKFGWHIIKLIDKKAVAPYEELRDGILKSFKNDERGNAGRKILAEKAKKEYGFTFYQENYNEILQYAEKYQYTDTAFVVHAANLQKPILKIGEKSVPQKQFVYYVFEKSDNELESAEEQMLKNINGFVEKEILAYEDANLEKKYPELKNLLQEYYDGILLFNISNEMVWDKAVKDREGLEKYFKENADNYTFSEPSFKGRVFYCKDKKTAAKVQKAVKKLPADSIASYLKTKINVDSVLVESQGGLWKKGDNKAIDKLGFKDKNADFTPSKTQPYVFVIGKTIAKPETYTDVRGAVTSDYQNFLEQEWMQSLFEKYKIEINPLILKEIELDSKTHFKK